MTLNLKKFLNIGTFIIIFSLSLFVVPAHAFEPSLVEILSHFGFTNIAETTLETFPLGTYNITLYAEFAAHYDENELSYYQIGTNAFNLLFAGQEGGSGYVSPITKTFTASFQLGLSLLSGGYRYFTEVSKNPYGIQHAKVYINLDEPHIFLIGFDEFSYCGGTGDGDYNDMVFSLQLQYYLTVVSPYDTPSGEGWYNNGTNAFASLADGVVDYANGTRRVFTHWSGDASGTDYSKSEPIYMNQNKTAIANWKTQYYLKIQTDPAGLSPAPTPFSDWYDKDVNVTLTALDKSNLGSSEYLFDYWDLDGISQGLGVTRIVAYMNRTHIATAHYKPAKYTLTILSSTGGTTNPAAGEHAYTAGSSVEVKATPEANYVFDHWELDSVNVGSANPYTVLMNKNHTLNPMFIYSPPTPPLSVSISPPSASILVGSSVSFTSTVSGGTPPYTYQWYSNSVSVPGATLSSWTFTPTSSGIYYVYLKVTDAKNNVVQSDAARITAVAVPVGGYSVSLSKNVPAIRLINYTMLMLMFGVALSLLRRKIK
jgi:hypothetical protein